MERFFAGCPHSWYDPGRRIAYRQSIFPRKERTVSEWHLFWRRGNARIGALLAILTGASAANGAHAGSWQVVGSMGQPHTHGAATLLPDGAVLISGGSVVVEEKEIVNAVVERFDPKTGRFVHAGAFRVARQEHEAVLLKDGRVLIVGGHDGVAMVDTVELFDPAAATAVVIGKLTQTRTRFTAALLPDGRVLIAGGFSHNPRGISGTAEIYDPAIGKLERTNSLINRRYRHATVALPDGRVVLLGGFGVGNVPLTDVEIFDPRTNRFSAAGGLVESRGNLVAQLLPEGRILVLGGVTTSDSQDLWLDSVEIYDPVSGRSRATGHLSQPRSEPAVVMLADGRILVAGGDVQWDRAAAGILRTADLIDPATGAATPAEPMSFHRGLPRGVRLPDGRALVFGGYGLPPDSEEVIDLVSAEAYTP
jgi:hypothetical protein